MITPLKKIFAFILFALFCCPRAFAQEDAASNANVALAAQQLPVQPAALMPSSDELVKKAWALQGQGDTNGALKMIDECVLAYSQQADTMAQALTDFPIKEKISEYAIMNDVATCYFIKGEILRDRYELTYDKDEAQSLRQAATDALNQLIQKYPYAQNFDPRGWYWSLKEKAQTIIGEIEKGSACPVDNNVYVAPTSINLSDEGSEFPVNYEKYGKFANIDTKDFNYITDDPVGLSKAAGEGVYPNSASIKTDPEFLAVKKNLPALNHWDLANSRDLNLAFYKWNMAPEPTGIKQFYLADILERAGLIKQAVKAYYACVVNFPKTYTWTYWHTPWYPSKVAIYRIKYLLKNHPDIGYELKDAQITIVNGFDNDIANDIYLVNPGKFIKTKYAYKSEPRAPDKITQVRGGDKVKLVRYENGDWQLLVDDKPFMIHGLTYTPARIGESPDKKTLANWTTQDVNKNGIVDAPYEAWVDENFNNIQDPSEKSVGDFELMKEMGVNCLRIYHHPLEPNKNLLRQMYAKYGIYTAMGDFIGKYTQGSNADWATGTDYDNETDQKNMLASVTEMVNNYKNEPYVLIWVIGNENVYGLGCNADKKPASFFKFADKAAALIKSLDPMKRPVMIASGDTLFLDIFAKNCPNIDIFGANVYRGKQGFLDYWDDVKTTADRPAGVTEYGAPAYGSGYSLKEAEDYQADYHASAWADIEANANGLGAGNAIGGFAFEWLDEWWKAYNPKCHDTAKLSAGPFLDGFYREEWFGICSQGNGTNSPFMRQLRKVYFVYKKMWNPN